MNFLVTGGGGFIGTNLVKELLAQGHRVRVIDKNPRYGHVAGTAVCDISDRDIIYTMCKGIDTIIHLAAETGVQPSVDDPEADMSVNVGGTFNMLQAAHKQGVKRFIFASSGAVLGDSPPPHHEKMIAQPTSPYGASKLAGEAYCSAFFHSYGLETVVLRFSNIYGPYAWHKSNLFVNFMRSALTKEPLHIYGDGHQTRDFLYVKDLVSAIISASTIDKIGGQIFQLASGRETSIREFLTLLNSTSDSLGHHPFPYVHEDARPGEVIRSYADISKAKAILQWEPRYRLVEGIRSTFKWYTRKHGDV